MKPVNRRVITAAAVILVVSVTTFAQDDDRKQYLAYTLEAAAIVTNPETAGMALSRWAEQQGGYFVSRSLGRLSLRVPTDRAKELRNALERTAVEVVRYNPGAADLREELAAVEAGITSREEALNEIFTYLDGSDVAATLAFEREMMELLGELEDLEGRRRLLLDRTNYARIEVALSSRQQQIPPRLPSSFAWINSMGLDSFLGGVR